LDLDGGLDLGSCGGLGFGCGGSSMTVF